jgi:uncharacterized protein with ParB-like and HNH nuclease domain
VKPSIQTLGHILYSPSQYVIPVFQRNYRWEEQQWAKLWESLDEIRQPEKKGNHFMGFLVFMAGLAQPGQHTVFHLIDGQQRLTTLSVLLAAIRNIARNTGQHELADEIDQDYLVHPRKKGDEHFRLLPKERDHDSYVTLVNGNGQPSGRLGEALDFFEEKLKDRAIDDPTILRGLFDTLTQRLEFMFATLEAENAYNIFKSLNSTGVPLGASDLIRNFVFMHVAPDSHDEFDRDLWVPLEVRFAGAGSALDEERFSRFFRDFLMSSGRYISPRDTFPAFEARYEATGFRPQDLARTLLEASSDYEVIAGAQTDIDPSVTQALAGLNALESSTTYPLLLSLFRLRREGQLSSEDLVRAIGMLRGFIFRRFVSGESSRGYGQMFVRGLSKGEGAALQRLEGYLLERGWPDDHRFETAFIKFPLYERGYTKHVLETFERSRGHKEPADLRETEIEHVLPQTLNQGWRSALGPEADRIQADWLHSPGNLTLSGYNAELWNHEFDIKRKRYAQSNVVLTREVAELDQWGEAEIADRGRLLANEAAQIWIGPAEQVSRPTRDVNDDEEGPGRRELRRRFWSALNDYLIAEYPELPDFEARPNWTIRLPSGIRHIGIDLRFALRRDNVGIDVWFWREASFPLWESIRGSPEPYNALVDSTWEFEQVEGRPRARIFLEKSVEDLRKESSWPLAQKWLGEKLSMFYEHVVPKLRQEMDRFKAD